MDRPGLDKYVVLPPSELQSIITTEFDASLIKGTSYDVRVGMIIWRDESEVLESDSRFLLKPQGVAEVVSLERLTLPTNVVGFASVKTALCDEGIMALNIGLVDPGYGGPLSTTLVNFSNRPYNIQQGDVMLRLTFFRCETSTARNQLTDEQYLKTKRQKILNFSDTFLNLKPAIEKIASDVFWRYAGIAGFLLALFAILVSSTLTFLSRNVWSPVDIKASVLSEVRAAKIDALEKQVETLRQQLSQLQKASVVPPSQPAPVPTTTSSSKSSSPPQRRTP
jgi:deoxycytidine triphosphate deaminase